MTIEDYKDYEEGVRQTSKYLASPVGFSNYQASSVSDQTIIRQNNTIIQLFIQLHKKIDSLNDKIDTVEEKLIQKFSNQKEDPDLESLIKSLENLKIGNHNPERKREPYKFGLVS